MTEAIQTWMKSDEGREAVEDVLRFSEKGQKAMPKGYEFPTIGTGKNLGFGYKCDMSGEIQVLEGLTKVKVVLHPDGVGGFILKTAFPTT